MKTSNKVFFFLIFSLIFLGSIGSFSTNAKAVMASDNLTIKANWLYDIRGDFIDSEHQPWETKIKFSLGGEDLLGFDNHGIVKINDTHVLYGSSVQFGFEVTAHTNVGWDDVFPDINLNVQHSEQFFKIWRLYVGRTDKEIHDVSWRTIDYGNITQYHEYDGVLPITVGIGEITPPSGVFSLNGVTFSIPTYLYNIRKVQIAEVRDGEAGAYKDIFKDIAGIEEGNVEFAILSDDFDATEAGIVKFYNDYGLGWSAGDIERGGDLHQLTYYSQQPGSSFHHIKYEENTPFTFDLPMTLEPGVFPYVQYNDIKHAEIRFFTYWPKAGIIEAITSPTSRVAPPRIVAVHTVNPFIHWDLTVDVDFYALIPITAELSKSILDDPYLIRGDMVWDTSFTGDYQVSVPLTTEPDIWDIIDDFFRGLFGNFGGIIILIAIVAIVAIGVFIFIKIAPILLLRRASRGRNN